MLGCRTCLENKLTVMVMRVRFPCPPLGRTRNTVVYSGGSGLKQRFVVVNDGTNQCCLEIRAVSTLHW